MHIAPWPALKSFLLLCLLGFCLLMARAYGQTGADAFQMAADAEPGTYTYKRVALIYGEAFRLLGIPVKISTYSLARRNALANEGRIDGEVSRISAYADANPHLIRVEEPVMDFSFALFATKPELRVQRIEDLATGKLVVEHRRGILMCENTLKKHVPADRLSNVTTTEQGLKKLLAGRTDLYCDLEDYVPETLHTAEFRGVDNVRNILRFASVPTYPYLASKHAALAPKLATVLKEMKREGLLDEYQRQAERDMGWKR